MKNAYFAFKNRQNAHFLKKKSLKNLVIQKKVVPLHPHSEECSLLRGITAEIAQLVEQLNILKRFRIFEHKMAVGLMHRK